MEVDASDVSGSYFSKTGDLKGEVDSLAEPLIEQKQTPGLIVGVLLPDSSTHFFGYGVTDSADDHLPSSNTLFAIGSVSKLFLGATVAITVQESDLSWSNTLEELLPPGTPLSDDAKIITLLQLATHTSGLPRQPNSLKTLFHFLRYFFTGESFYSHLDRECLLNYMARFKAPKDSVPQYSNIGYGLLAYILEVKTGDKLEILVNKKVMAPLSLSSTSYTPKKLTGYNTRARGHAGDQPLFIRRGRPAPDWKFTDVMTGGAALYSNADDLLKYAHAYLHGSGNDLIDRSLKDMLAIRFDRPKGAAAITWIVDHIAGRKITYVVGFVGGYSCYLGMDVDNQIASVVMQNCLNWDYSLGHKLILRMKNDTPKIRADCSP